MVDVAVGEDSSSVFILTYANLPMRECEKTLRVVARLYSEPRCHAADYGLASGPVSRLHEALDEPVLRGLLSHRYPVIESKTAIGHMWEPRQVVIDYLIYAVFLLKRRFAGLDEAELPFIQSQLDSVPIIHKGYSRSRDRLGDFPTLRHDRLRYQEIPVENRRIVELSSNDNTYGVQSKLRFFTHSVRCISIYCAPLAEQFRPARSSARFASCAQTSRVCFSRAMSCRSPQLLV